MRARWKHGSVLPSGKSRAAYDKNVGTARDNRPASGVRTVVLVISLTLGLPILIVSVALLWISIYFERHAPERIVGPQGALLAMNDAGLRRLNELYALPKTCTESNMRKAQAKGQVLAVLALCQVPKPPAEIEKRIGLVDLLPGTEAVATDRMFALPGGRLVKPYAANTFDMARDGAVEVEHIKAQQNRIDGWVVPWQLQRVCCPMP